MRDEVPAWPPGASPAESAVAVEWRREAVSAPHPSQRSADAAGEDTARIDSGFQLDGNELARARRREEQQLRSLQEHAAQQDRPVDAGREDAVECIRVDARAENHPVVGADRVG